MFATLHDRYFFPMMRQCIQMYLKYCGPCQMYSMKKLDKCPHEMQPVKVPKEAWSQIGEILNIKITVNSQPWQISYFTPYLLK